MSMDRQHRILWLVLAALMLAAIAAYLFFPQDDLRELKQTETVAEGADEAAACIRTILAAAEAKDNRKLASLMFTPDKTELERVTAPLYEEPALGEVKILGCSRLKHSSRKENFMVDVYSAARGKTYLFVLVKDAQGKLRLYDIGLSARKL